jgi:biotin carboxylase
VGAVCASWTRPPISRANWLRRSRNRRGFRQRRGVSGTLHPAGEAYRSADSGDRHGNILHLYERDCSVQRGIRKWSRWRPAVSLDRRSAQALADAAVKLARAGGYYNAGTVEFLVDADSGEWFFIEVKPRIQVEHTVTEMVTGIDLVARRFRLRRGRIYSAPR